MRVSGRAIAILDAPVLRTTLASMPSSPPSSCLHPGCPALTKRGYCEAHLRPPEVRESKYKKSATQKAFYNSPYWQSLRDRQLVDNPWCVYQLSDGSPCNRAATEVDHIIPRSKGGTDTSDNFQSLCHSHHSKKTCKEDAGFGRYKRAKKLILVCGPPGAGKSTYVARHWRKGDIVVDLDRLKEALSCLPGHEAPDHVLPLALAAQAAVIECLRAGANINKAWIIACAPTGYARQDWVDRNSASIVMIETTVDVCVERTKERPQPPGYRTWRDLAESWWQEYQPRDGDEIVLL